MFPPFNPKIAYEYCLKLKDALDSGALCLEQVTQVSEERRGQGVMIGCLVCVDDEGKRVVLAANSGISKQIVRWKPRLQSERGNVTEQEICLSAQGSDCSIKSVQAVSGRAWEVPSGADDFVIVPPIVSAEEIDKALGKNDREIHELTEKINRLSAQAVLGRAEECHQSERAGECSSKSEQAVWGRAEKCHQSEQAVWGGSLEKLKSRRAVLTTESLSAVHALYKFNRIDGTVFTLPKNQQVPTGTGDCCEPKLLHYAFSHGLQPISMAQIYYGGEMSSNPNGYFGAERKISSQSGRAGVTACGIPSIPPCDERCGILLPQMLGLEILYVDEHIVVVNKQSGLLSVPGRGEDKQDCIVNRVKKLYPDLCKITQPSVHRLDMETSGVLVLAFTEEAHKNLSRQFENREIEKEYVALLSGVLEKDATGELAPHHGEKSGIIKLKFRLDVENRPHQIYDEVYGKEGITEWENLGLVWYTAPDGTKIKSTKIRFRPRTGRTHQLRLVSADSHGFGLPIIGDTLYGNCKPGERLMLHAEKLSFTHPATGERMEFVKTASVPF